MRALKECDPVVKDFVECTQGRSVSLIWACREKYRLLQQCMLQYTGPESMDILRAEYVRLRDRSGPQAAQTKQPTAS